MCKGWLLISSEDSSISLPVEIYPCLIKSCSGANNPEEFNDENLVEIHVQVQREHF